MVMNNYFKNFIEKNSLTNEIWKTVDYIDVKSGKRIVDNELYCSNLGRFISVRKGNPVLLKLFTQNAGYEIVRCNNTYLLVHRIVAHMFLNTDNLGDATEIDHLNGNKTDNRVSNLRFIKHHDNLKRRKARVDIDSDNLYDFICMVDINSDSKDCSKGYTNKTVYCFDREGHLLNIFNSVCQINRLCGLSAQMVSECCNLKRNYYKKLIWSYSKDISDRLIS